MRAVEVLRIQFLDVDPPRLMSGRLCYGFCRAVVDEPTGPRIVINPFPVYEPLTAETKKKMNEVVVEKVHRQAHMKVAGPSIRVSDLAKTEPDKVN